MGRRNFSAQENNVCVAVSARMINDTTAVSIHNHLAWQKQASSLIANCVQHAATSNDATKHRRSRCNLVAQCLSRICQSGIALHLHTRRLISLTRLSTLIKIEICKWNVAVSYAINFPSRAFCNKSKRADYHKSRIFDLRSSVRF